jgi:hypothetical protein
MNDTLTPKDIVFSTIGATQLPGAARSFPRVASPNSDYRRLSSHISSLSPTVIRVSHQPRSSKSTIQRSLFAVDQTLTRLDASSNPISKTTFKVAFQTDIPSDVTLAEWRAALSILFGALQESDGALLTAMYNGEF